jgi:hypothetical protein
LLLSGDRRLRRTGLSFGVFAARWHERAPSAHVSAGFCAWLTRLIASDAAATKEGKTSPHEVFA